MKYGRTLFGIICVGIILKCKNKEEIKSPKPHGIYQATLPDSALVQLEFHNDGLVKIEEFRNGHIDEECKANFSLEGDSVLVLVESMCRSSEKWKESPAVRFKVRNLAVNDFDYFRPGNEPKSGDWIKLNRIDRK